MNINSDRRIKTGGEGLYIIYVIVDLSRHS